MSRCSSSIMFTIIKHQKMKSYLIAAATQNHSPFIAARFTTRSSSSTTSKGSSEPRQDDIYNHSKVTAMIGHNFPDYIEKWNRNVFRKVGYAFVGLSGASLAWPISMELPLSHFGAYAPSLILTALTAAYWHVGLSDMKQTQHAIRRNYPVLGNFRYILETVRPEIRQYFVEADTEGRPFDRTQRSLVYQRSKNVDCTTGFGTLKKVYDVRHEWACHSMFPTHVDPDATRCLIGSAAYGTNAYSASIFNISAMSYGALGDNAITALNRGAKLGNFYHNTGEGGVSKFHCEGGDLVWNVGTGYFGCGTNQGDKRIFNPDMFKETLESCNGKIKMIEVKLSQGAKPGHGGLLPKKKITMNIAEARKIPWPAEFDCHSPSRHSAFSNQYELVEFIAKLRELGNGIPVGVKMCVGHPGDIARFCRAIHEIQNGPDFITIDGAEGGTGAAPPEFMNSVGLPLEEGLVLARNMFDGAGLRGKTKIIASGKVLSGFDLLRTIALGADVVNSARGFMLSLGCIQALKCQTNKCPTGITTQDKMLMAGLDPEDKMVRVYNYHIKTVNAAGDILGAMGYSKFSSVCGDDIMRRIRPGEVRTLSEQFPSVEAGCLLRGVGPTRLQEIWDSSERLNTPGAHRYKGTRWIY